MYFTSTDSQCNNKCQVLSLRVILMYIISNISRAIYAESHGVRFTTGNVVCLCIKEDAFPSFGFITKIIIVADNIFFILNKAVTDYFESSYLAYHVYKTNEMCIVVLDDLAHQIPLFPQTVSGDMFVKLRNSSVTEFLE